MSLYKEYIFEREQKEIIEGESGFATFKIFDKECYLQDIYVKPELRQTKLASKMADEVCNIARNRGCSFLIGSVSIDDANATRNMKVFLNYNMELYKIAGSMIFLRKNIEAGK